MSIDTSTTAGKIEMMQWFENNPNKLVQRKPHDETKWLDVICPNWNWGTCDFRKKRQTLEEAAQEYVAEVKSPCADQVIEDFKAGVKWRDENPKDQSND